VKQKRKAKNLREVGDQMKEDEVNRYT
jgi:hypothetical protein